MMPYQPYDDDELYHFGIKGMKWGVRRFQNKNGSYTSAGKGRYNSSGGTRSSGSNSAGHPRLRTAAKIAGGVAGAAALAGGAYALKRSGAGSAMVKALRSNRYQGSNPPGVIGLPGPTQSRLKSGARSVGSAIGKAGGAIKRSAQGRVNAFKSRNYKGSNPAGVIGLPGPVKPGKLRSGVNTLGKWAKNGTKNTGKAIGKAGSSFAGGVKGVGGKIAGSTPVKRFQNRNAPRLGTTLPAVANRPVGPGRLAKAGAVLSKAGGRAKSRASWTIQGIKSGRYAENVARGSKKAGKNIVKWTKNGTKNTGKAISKGYKSTRDYVKGAVQGVRNRRKVMPKGYADQFQDIAGTALAVRGTRRRRR